MFVLSSDITIGNFRFGGVHEVNIKRSLHSIVETAVIKIPSVAKVVTGNNALPGVITTGQQFSDGDPVTIKLGYDGVLQNEFVGFVKRRNLDMPLEIECEGYSWLLRRTNVNIGETTITISELLRKAVASIEGGYAIKIQCTADYTLENVNIPHASGFDIINNIAKYTDGALNCFFIQPDTLWCGLVYTPYAGGNDVFDTGLVNYKLGYNAIKNNSLKERLSENDPVKVTYNTKLSTGDKVSESSDVFKDFVRAHSKVLTQLKDATALKQLANEKAYKLNYSGYEGCIQGFLQPYAAPGYQAYVADERYPERNGTYIIEGIEVRFGINGARRTAEIGPMLGFGKIISK